MGNAPRFSISHTAEKFLRSVSERRGLEMGLFLAYGFESKDADGRITDQYAGNHFYVAWNEASTWSGEQVAIAGNKFWIPSDVAEALQNKTLTIIRREGDLESLLVAA